MRPHDAVAADSICFSWTVSNMKQTNTRPIASLTISGNVTGFDLAAVSLEPGPRASASAPAGPVIVTGGLQHPVKTLYTI